MRTLCLLAVSLGVCSSRAAIAEEVPPSPCRAERWADAMAAFDAAAKESTPPADALLFVGSSSIRLWDLEKWFPELPVINRGFGGSEICDSIHYFDELVTRYRPKAVVFYAGDNDIAGGKSAAQVHRDFLEFAAHLEQALPKTPLYYIAIKPSLARWQLAEEMEQANHRIAESCKELEQARFVDIWHPMLGDDGKPRPELFLDDGLHLNEQGYKLWTQLVKTAEE